MRLDFWQDRRIDETSLEERGARGVGNAERDHPTDGQRVATGPRWKLDRDDPCDHRQGCLAIARRYQPTDDDPIVGPASQGDDVARRQRVHCRGGFLRVGRPSLDDQILGVEHEEPCRLPPGLQVNGEGWLIIGNR